MDKSTIGGIILALAGILAGLILEGGKIAQILQPTAAMIVFGGTIGAVMIQFPLPIVIGAAKALVHVFFNRRQDPNQLIKELVGYANRARKDGVVSLDTQLATIKDPFLKKALMLAIDGAEPQELRKMMELELDNQEEYGERLSQVFEAAGGFSPPSASSAPCWGSSRSCSISKTSPKLVRELQLLSLRPSMEWGRPTSSFYRGPGS